ncbi:MAG: electron transfer flavoprotein subunit alpha/FixB family protein [Zestosphaera sp.]
MWSGVLVYAENYGRGLKPSVFELLGKASELRNKLGGLVYSVVLTSEGVEVPAEELISYGSDKVLVYRVPKELLPNQLVHMDALVDAVKAVKPKLILISATPWGRGLGPRVAARLKTGITADCLDIYVDEDGDIVQVRPAFTGNVIAYIKTLRNPAIATVRPKVFPTPEPDHGRRGDVLCMELNTFESDVAGVKVLGVAKEKLVRLSEAEVIVSVGKGLRGREDLRLFEELARVLGAQVACSRPLVDMGWMERDRQVGFSGNVVRPRIYIACGISGAPQHLAGMRDSEYVIAVNTDASAPIGRHSDLLVVGDFYEVVPKLLERIKELRGKL